MSIFIRTRIYPSPPAPDVFNVNELGAIEIDNYMTANPGVGNATPSVNFSSSQPIPVPISGTTGGVAATVDTADNDYTDPIGGIETSSWS